MTAPRPARNYGNRPERLKRPAPHRFGRKGGAAAPEPSTSSDYMGMTVEQRYSAVSQSFAPWLLTEPIEFPAHHDTYGWACLVEDCPGRVSLTRTRLLCSQHAKQYKRQEGTVELDEFLRDAKPVAASRQGWALSRRPDCVICGSNREALPSGYCTMHANLLRKAQQRTGPQRKARSQWFGEEAWRRIQRPLKPAVHCSVPLCVRNSGRKVDMRDGEHRLCDGHIQQWADWRKKVRRHDADPQAWDAFVTSSPVQHSVSLADTRGQLSLAKLPQALQNEIRYALHRHATRPRRSQWRPEVLQVVIDVLAEHGVTSVFDQLFDELANKSNGAAGVPTPEAKLIAKYGRRIWLGLPDAARSLVMTEDIAKDAGWFDPIVVGATPFRGLTAGATRFKVWDLTPISQRWLRDLIWDHLRDGSLMADGKRPQALTMNGRITAVVVLSSILRQIREDHGDDVSQLGKADAMAIKDIWDLWFREKMVVESLKCHRSDGVLTLLTRHTHIRNMRIVLQRSQELDRTPPALDPFIFNFPDYAAPRHSPRPRPLTEEDFRLLVCDESIAALEALDLNDVGLADMWLTHAWQGGRISETLTLKLGCIGHVGHAPYIWRDISKINVIDYGMPCYEPVHERLQQRQQKTRTKLRERYAQQIAALDHRGREKLETRWDLDMPLFPGTQRNPDLSLAVSQGGFRNIWEQWFESLGLKWITTHQMRATMATNLLNNGAPPALVRQVLGHMSEGSLAHYARYNDDTVRQHLQQVWAAGPGTDKPGTILLRPTEVKADHPAAAAARIDLATVPVEHGLCRYGPVVGGSHCPFQKNCSDSDDGPCEHFVLTGADLAYWERKRDRDYHFAEAAPNDEAREYILSRWSP